MIHSTGDIMHGTGDTIQVTGCAMSVIILWYNGHPESIQMYISYPDNKEGAIRDYVTL